MMWVAPGRSGECGSFAPETGGWNQPETAGRTDEQDADTKLDAKEQQNCSPEQNRWEED